MKTLAIINSAAPFGQINYRESLDMALANASFDRPIALFFYGDGLFQIVKGTDGTLTGHKELGKTFALLEMMDVEDIFFCQQSLETRSLTPKHLLLDGEVLNQGAWFEKISQFDQVINF